MSWFLHFELCNPFLGRHWWFFRWSSFHEQSWNLPWCLCHPLSQCAFQHSTSFWGPTTGTRLGSNVSRRCPLSSVRIRLYAVGSWFLWTVFLAPLRWLLKGACRWDRYKPSSGSLVILPMGRWFIRLATYSKQVYNSNGDRTCSPIAIFRAFLVPLTNASAQPFWCGAPGVINCHLIPFSALNSLSSLWFHP